MAVLENVPWKLVLEQLPFTDLIRLRLVNAKWKRLIDAVLSEKRELVLFIGCSPDLPVYWHHNDLRVNRDHSWPANTSLYASQWFSGQFREITSLMMVVSTFLDCIILDKHSQDYRSGKATPETGDLNHFVGQFEKLLHLQIVLDRGEVYQYRIRSKTLQTLHLVQANPYGIQELACKNLVEFSLSCDLKLLTNSLLPSHLKYLRCGSLRYEEKPVCFPFLEVLVLENQQTAIQLDYFPQLQKLHFDVVKEWLLLDVIKARDRSKRALKIFLFGVHFAFERDHFDSEQSYCKTIRGLHCELMGSKPKIRDWIRFSLSSLALRFWRRYLWCTHQFRFIPCGAIDLEFLRFYVRCKGDFESNGIPYGIILYSDELGQILEALRADDPSMYKDLAKCVDYAFFQEQLINKERLLKLKDFFQWITIAYLEEFTPELLDLLPDFMPHIRHLVVNSIDERTDVPIDCKFISKLPCLESVDVLTKRCAPLTELRNIFRNCKYIAEAKLGKFSFIKLYAIRDVNGDGEEEPNWLFEKHGFNLPNPKKLPIDALLDHCESLPEFSRNELSLGSSPFLNKLTEYFQKFLG